MRKTQRNGKTLHAHDWKKKYCENVYATQSNQHTQCNPIDIFHGAGTNNHKISIETVKTLNSQRNVEKENQSWWNHNA